LIVTPLCTMDFETETHLARLATLHPGVTLEDVQEATGFTPILPAKLETTPTPTPEELAILRRLDPAGLLRGSARS
jgi:glutaconate CoA-transferase, subunit B